MPNKNAPSAIWSGQADTPLVQDAAYSGLTKGDRGYIDSQILGTQQLVLKGVVTTTTASFTQPAVNSNVTVALSSTTALVPGLPVFVQGGGVYTVISVGSTTSAVFQNTGASGNASPTATVNGNAKVVGSGLPGAPGAAGTLTGMKRDAISDGSGNVTVQGLNTQPMTLTTPASVQGEAWLWDIPSGTYKLGVPTATITPVFFSALATLTASASRQSQNIDGYAAVGDGGQGRFDWNSTSTATADGGTVVAVTGISTGRWARVFTGSFDVRWFGAVADNGTTDNQPPFQLAIAAAARVGGSVYVPRPLSGNYYGFASPLLISGDAGAAGIRFYSDSSSPDLTGGGGQQQPWLKAVGSSAFAANSGTGGALATYAGSGTGAQVTAYNSVTATGTITGLTGMVNGAAGTITLSSSSVTGNNNPWAIKNVLSATSVTAILTPAASPGPDTGGDHWSVTGTSSTNGTSVVLSNVSSAALAKVAVGDICAISNTATAGNASLGLTVTSVTPGSGTGSCVLTFTGGLNAACQVTAFTTPDAGLSGGISWSFKKPLLKAWAEGIRVENLIFDGSNLCGRVIDLANDASGATLTTNTKFEHLGVLNGVDCWSIGDSAGTGNVQSNCDFGFFNRCYCSGFTRAGWHFPSRGGQQKSYEFNYCSAQSGQYAIYQVSGSFHTTGCAWTGQTVSAIALSSTTDYFVLNKSNCESGARFLQVAFSETPFNVIIDGLRFDSSSLTDGSLIQWRASGVLLARNVEANYGSNITTHLVALDGDALVTTGSSQTQVYISGASLGGDGPLVVAFSGQNGGVYDSDGTSTFSDGANPPFPAPKGRFTVSPEGGAVVPPAVQPEYVPNLALTTMQMATLASGANVAIPYQGASVLEMHGDPGGSFAINGMVAPPSAFALNGAPGDSQVTLYLYAARQVTIAHLDSNAAAGARFACAAGGSGGAGGGTSSIVLAAPPSGGYVQVSARYSPTGDAVALASAATTNVHNGSAAVTFSAAQTLKAGQWLLLGGIPYRLASAVTAATSGTLTIAYAGTTNATLATTACNGAWLVTSAVGAGALAGTGVGAITVANGLNDNIVVGNEFVRVTNSGGAYTLGGFILSGSVKPLPSQKLVLQLDVTPSAQAATLKHNSGTSTYPLLLAGAADVPLGTPAASGYTEVKFWFDGAAWRQW